jgi:hypothetical protein
MTHAQKTDFAFRRNGRIHLNWREGRVSTFDCWQASCTHQPAGFVLLVRACILQSCDAYWLPTPFSCFTLHFSARASPCAITFQTQSTTSCQANCFLPCLLLSLAYNVKYAGVMGSTYSVRTPGPVHSVCMFMNSQSIKHILRSP